MIGRKPRFPRPGQKIGLEVSDHPSPSAHAKWVRAGKTALISAAVLAGAAALTLGFVLSVPQGFTWGGAVTVLALVPLLVPERYRHIGTGLAGIAILTVVGLGILSIGPYFLPALACMVFSSVAYFLARRSAGVRA